MFSQRRCVSQHNYYSVSAQVSTCKQGCQSSLFHRCYHNVIATIRSGVEPRLPLIFRDPLEFSGTCIQTRRYSLEPSRRELSNGGWHTTDACAYAFLNTCLHTCSRRRPSTFHSIGVIVTWLLPWGLVSMRGCPSSSLSQHKCYRNICVITAQVLS